MKNGIELIAEERLRQIEEQGFDAAHDDLELDDELVRVAICYASHASELYLGQTLWPKSWDRSWDKRTKHDRKKKLAIAGALIAAELDRLIRAEEKESNAT